MKIEYLEKMAATPVIDGRVSEGMSESEIEELEKEAGKNFRRPTVSFYS